MHTMSILRVHNTWLAIIIKKLGNLKLATNINFLITRVLERHCLSTVLPACARITIVSNRRSVQILFDVVLLEQILQHWRSVQSRL